MYIFICNMCNDDDYLFFRNSGIMMDRRKDERCLALCSAGAIARILTIANLQYSARNLSFSRLYWMKSCSSDNHYRAYGKTQGENFTFSWLKVIKSTRKKLLNVTTKINPKLNLFALSLNINKEEYVLCTYTSYI